MKYFQVQKSRALSGEIEVPGDKSISHRALILASIAEGETTIKGLLKGEDNMATLAAFRKMGVEILEEGETVVVRGKGLHGLEEPDDIIDAGNSGTTMRLLAGLLSGQSFYSLLTGDEYLRKRPMKRVVSPLSEMGARIFGREGGDKAPLAIVGSKLKGIGYVSPVASAQVKSALLLAGLYADGTTTVTEPTLSRDHTERMLAAFGAKIDSQGTTVSLSSGQTLKGCHVVVPGDISSAAFFIVAALITEGSEVVIKNVGVNPTRTGVIDILKMMGGEIEIKNLSESSGEPVGDIHVKSSKLRGAKIGGDVIPRAIDELPVVAVAASFADGVTVIADAGELRVKETDRIETMATELRRLGVDVATSSDGMEIAGGVPVGARCESYGDHRVAMSMAVAGLAAEGETVVRGTECIETSFPGFEGLLKKIGT